MQVGLRISHREKNPISDRALLFAFFAAGVSAAYFGSVQLSLFSEPRLFFSGLMAGVLLFSASLLGAYLLPLAAMLLGAFTEQTAMGTAALWRSEHMLDLPTFAPGLILVPVFFLAAVHGMAVTSAVQGAMERGSPTARAVFQRELAAVFVFVLMAFAAIFFFY